MCDDLGYGDLQCYNPESKIEVLTLTAWQNKAFGSPDFILLLWS